MKEIISKLRAFHEKNRFKLDVPLDQCRDAGTDFLLTELAAELALLAKDAETRCMRGHPDMRLHRAQLMVEEVGEAIEALAQRDELKLLDGLADTQFVVIGTSEAFGLPTREALVEVCDSNLTKDARADDDVRLRRKGPNFCPPDMERVLREHRTTCPVCHAHAIAPGRDTCVDCSH